MSEFTPGPWSIGESTQDWTSVVDCQEVTVANIPQQPFDTWRASDNARLIAAAPDMLNACEQALSDLRFVESKGNADFRSSILLLEYAINNACP